jgi:hypothetical protein
MSRPDPHDVLLDMEQQIAATAVRIQRLREMISALESKGACTQDQHELMQTLTRAQFLLIERRERLAGRIRATTPLASSIRGPDAVANSEKCPDEL